MTFVSTPYGNFDATLSVRGHNDDVMGLYVTPLGNLSEDEAYATSHDGRTIPDHDKLKAERRRQTPDLPSYWTPGPVYTINRKAYEESFYVSPSPHATINNGHPLFYVDVPYSSNPLSDSARAKLAEAFAPVYARLVTPETIHAYMVRQASHAVQSKKAALEDARKDMNTAAYAEHVILESDIPQPNPANHLHVQHYFAELREAYAKAARSAARA